MATQILRSASTSVGNVAFGTSVANCTSICLASSAAFAVIVPAGTTSTTITWHASHKDDGPYFPVILSSGSAASTAVAAGRVYIAPPELYSCPYIRGVVGTAFDGVVVMKT